MPRFTIEEVLGIFNEDGSITCAQCMEKDDWDNLSSGMILTQADIDSNEDIYICDSHNGRIL